MKSFRCSLVLAGLFSCAALVRGSSQPSDYPGPVTLAEVEITWAPLEPIPLPFQALGLTASIRNITDRELGPILGIEGMIARVKVLKEPVGLAGQEGVTMTVSRSAARGPLTLGALRLSCHLKPGDRQTVTYAIAANWDGGQKHWPRALRADPLFLHPGEYTLQCVLQEDSTDGRPRIAKELTVRVAEPRGDDRTIYEQLQQDPELVDALFLPVEAPRDEVLPRLRRLVEKYPRSSYATYARFQLAQRDAVGFPADAERRARGAMALEELLTSRFPYQSFAILRLRDADPREAGRVERLLDRYFPDAKPWIAERRRRPGTTPAAWAAFRRQRAKEWDPTDPDLSPRPDRPSGDRP